MTHAHDEQSQTGPAEFGTSQQPAGLPFEKTNRRRFLTIGGLAAGAVVVGGTATACGTAQPTKSGEGGGSGSSQGRQGESANYFFIAGLQWDPPDNWNPLSTSQTFPAGGDQPQILFETLVRFNQLDGSLRPGLAKEIVDVDERTLEVPLQDGTAWRDGTELTADDVVFTFQLAKDNSVSYSSVWDYLESVEAVDDRTIRFTAKEDPVNLLAIKDAINGTYIIPKHIWEDIVDGGKYAEEANEDPVGSGAFVVETADQTQIVLKKADSYWGKDVIGDPPMTKIIHPIFKSNQDGDLKLESGEIDGSQQFTAQIWKMWENGAPVGTWLKDKPYYLPGNIPLLQFNVTLDGLKEKLVRRAIATAIDTPNIVKTAMSDYSDVPQASLIIPTGSEEKFFDQASVDKDGWTYDPDEAVRILEEDLGAKKNGDGIYELKDGTKLGGWTLITPTGWTDWNTSCEIVAKSLNKIGIGVKTEFPQAANVTSRMQNGDFEMAMWSASGVGPASPWSRFRDTLDDRLGAPIGKTAFANFTRFSDPDIAELLDKAAATTDEAEQKAAYNEIDAIFRDQVPVVPLMYRPLQFYEYNEGTWTNFPDEKNPYAPPMWGNAGVEWLYQLKKAGS